MKCLFLRYYDDANPEASSIDASENGLGGVLIGVNSPLAVEKESH